jgi:isoleucyl-tRNA synthetase
MNKNNLLDDAKKVIDDVNWEPSWGLQRIKSMLEDRPDWCISRQRNWGVPITLVVHKDTGDIHPNQSSLFKEFAEVIEKNGISAWDKLDLKEYIQDSNDYIKITDSLDVWFDSGVTHYAVSSQRFEG